MNLEGVVWVLAAGFVVLVCLSVWLAVRLERLEAEARNRSARRRTERRIRKGI